MLPVRSAAALELEKTTFVLSIIVVGIVFPHAALRAAIARSNPNRSLRHSRRCGTSARGTCRAHHRHNFFEGLAPLHCRLRSKHKRQSARSEERLDTREICNQRFTMTSVNVASACRFCE